MSRSEMLQELRNSAAKIVTDSKKRAKATARKFTDTGRASQRSLPKFRSTISSGQDALKSPLSEPLSDEGRSKITGTAAKNAKSS